jgi:hypothetical protein
MVNEKIINSLSPLERKIIPFITLSFKEIKEKSRLDSTSILRALKFLENKEILKLEKIKTEIVELGINGIRYQKKHLPERVLLTFLEKNSPINLQEAEKQSNLSQNEFKVSLGILKSKALIDLKDNKIFLTASKEELIKKTFEETLLEKIPIEKSKLIDTDLLALKNLKKRKEIIEIKEKTNYSISLTDLGKELGGKTLQI